MLHFPLFGPECVIIKSLLQLLLLELRMKTDYFYTAQHLHRVYGRLIFRFIRQNETSLKISLRHHCINVIECHSVTF